MTAPLTAQAGCVNIHLSKAVAKDGLHYAPDPSSQGACTVGGNVAENSGGAHCLKYGFTTTHVLALEVVLPDGSLVHFGSRAVDRPGYDLPGIFVGSEGTLGIATKVVLRIVKKPEDESEWWTGELNGKQGIFPGELESQPEL